jgi:trimethylamine--corrinoid protein Co-methyltransferase
MGRARLRILTDSEIEAIHAATMEVLQEVGVRVYHEGVLKHLAGLGVEINEREKCVRFSEALVKEFLKRVPGSFPHHGRSRRHHVELGDGREMRFMSSGGQLQLVDPLTRTRRPGTLNDTIQAVRLGDALEGIDIVGAMVVPSDVDYKVADIYMHSVLVKNTTKPAFAWINTPGSARHVLRIYEAVYGEDRLSREPPVWYLFEPISPLKLPDNGLEIMRLFVERGLPVCFGPMVMAGASGPITLAGTLVVENAEILASNTIAQSLNPGVPTMYGGIPHVMDLKQGTISFGSPEQGVMAAAVTQLGRYYGFPVHVNVALTDSKIPDFQAGAEKAATALMGALAGADLSGHQGISGADQGACLEQLVLDSELAGYIEAVVRELTVDVESLAIELIKEVGVGGLFLTKRHTIRRFHTLWQPRLFDRLAWERWEAREKPDALIKARRRAEELLQAHSPEPLERDLAVEVDRVVEEGVKAVLKA